MPKIKAGPALLQNPSIRCASVFVRQPLRYASDTDCAPTGYPPKKPMRSSDSAPVGIPQSFPKGVRKGIFVPVTAFVRRMDSTKKGSNDGITVRMHMSMLSAAPYIAVLLSRISAVIPIPESIADRILLRLVIAAHLTGKYAHFPERITAFFIGFFKGGADF